MDNNVIQQKIFEVKGYRVMLDFDLAELYGVPTKVLNQAVKRNLERFPEDFMFQLTKDQWETLRSQFVTLKNGRGKYHKYVPNVFTEHGVTMLASVLHSEQAIAMNIVIVRAFIALREVGMHYKELADKKRALEKRYNKQFVDIHKVLEILLVEKENMEDFEKRERIGFKMGKS